MKKIYERNLLSHTVTTTNNKYLTTYKNVCLHTHAILVSLVVYNCFYNVYKVDIYTICKKVNLKVT